MKWDQLLNSPISLAYISSSDMKEKIRADQLRTKFMG